MLSRDRDIRAVIAEAGRTRSLVRLLAMKPLRYSGKVSTCTNESRQRRLQDICPCGRPFRYRHRIGKSIRISCTLGPSKDRVPDLSTNARLAVGCRRHNAPDDGEVIPVLRVGCGAKCCVKGTAHDCGGRRREASDVGVGHGEGSKDSGNEGDHFREWVGLSYVGVVNVGHPMYLAESSEGESDA